jgi:hypothetical protein
MIPIFRGEESIPHSLGDFERQGVLESENRDLGVQIRYERGASKIDIYLYDAGTYPVPRDIQDPLVLDHFKSCCSNILTLQEIGTYRDVTLEVCDAWEMVEPNSDVRFLHACFSLGVEQTSVSIDIGNQASHLLLSSRDGYFLKIRFTHPADPERIKDIEPFLIDLAKELKNANT